MLLLATTVKLIAEIALLSLLGRWLLGLLVTGAGRERNFFYQVLRIAGQPFVALARLCCPVADDKYLWLIASVSLLAAWITATAFKIWFCLHAGMNLCK